MNLPAEKTADHQNAGPPTTEDNPTLSDTEVRKFILWETYLLWFVLAVVFFSAFLPAFTGENDFILRDVGRYYMNFYRLVQEEWDAGRIPLWTPYDNCGTPLLANPCTAVFYPPKLIFFLPCSFELNLKIFILAHFVLTFLTMRALALELGLTSKSSILVGAFFLFSTPVLFGYCNLPFLCGTAWLPLAVLFGWRLLHLPTFRSAWLLGGCLSLMVLAGDPQTAYHTGLILGIALILGIGTKHNPAHQTRSPEVGTLSSTNGFFTRRIQPAKWLIVGATLAGGISAMQVLPTMEYNKTSVRAANQTPDSIWGVPAFLLREERLKQGLHWYDTFIGNPAKPAKHYLQIYAFSYSPMRLFEWIIPETLGQSIKPQARWSCRWGMEEGNVWFPSVSMGIIPLILAFIALANIRTDHSLFNVMSWLRWISILSLLASFGRFGIYGCWTNLLVWLGFITPEEAPLTGGEIGGLYWLMVTLLPGYGGFRFPAKWLVFTVFGLSILAGMGFQILENQTLKLQWTKRVCLANSAISLASLLVLWLINLSYEFTDPGAKLSDSEMMNIATACLAGFAYWIIPLMLLDKRDNTKLTVASVYDKLQPFNNRYFLGFIAISSLTFNANCIELYPRKYWKQTSTVADTINQHHENSPVKNPAPPRFFRPDYYVPTVNEQSDWFQGKFKGLFPRHQEALSLALERDVLSGFMHIEEHCNSVHQFVTIDHEAYEAMFDVVPLPDGSGFFHPRRAYDLWGTKYFITHKSLSYGDLAKTNSGLTQTWGLATSQDFLPQGTNLIDLIQPDSELSLRYPDLMIKLNDDAFPLARIVHRYTTIPTLHPLDIQARNQLYFQMFLGINGGMDHQREAVVELTHPEITQAVLTNFKISTEDLKQELCNIIFYSPQRISLDVELKQPGLVILSELYYPGWKCKVMATSEPTPKVIPNPGHLLKSVREHEIKKVNHLMRGILIEKPGRYQVELIYWPDSFVLGCWITFLTLLLILWWEFRIQWLK